MSAVAERADTWLRDTLHTLLTTDTGVPAGEFEVQPGDPRIVRAVDDVLLPLLTELRPDEVRRHPLGDVAVRFGPDTPDGLLVQTYAVSQHGEPGEPVVVTDDGGRGTVVAGRGASQNKGPMAAAFAAVRARPDRLRRPVWLAVNTEGRSSHGGSRRIIDDLAVRAAGAVLATGTDLAVSLGNRGRVDVLVTARGEPHHSSRPGRDRNPLDVAADVIAALRTLPVPPPHPELGPALVTPYRVTADPVAPHTVPATVEVTVDHRLLPGGSPEVAVEAVRRHLREAGGLDVDVGAGPWMLPAAVAPDDAVVRALGAGVRTATGREPVLRWSSNTFDAGYGCARNIPTCMFGPGRRELDAGVTAPESVSVADCRAAARALVDAVTALCT